MAFGSPEFRRRALTVVGAGGWALWAGYSAATTVWAARTHVAGWAYDWSVYLAGARDFLDRSLYRHPLPSVGVPTSAADFKLPPFAAVPALPMAGLSLDLGGVIWAAVNLVAFAIAMWILVELLEVRPVWAWTGITLGLFTTYSLWPSIIALGNVNPLELGIVAAFALAHVRNRQRSSGLLLGLAIAIKLWPVMLLGVVLRARQWTALRWCLGFLLMQAIAILLWLGPDVIGPMLATTQAPIEFKPDIFYVSWMAHNVSWWPAWGGVAVAVALVSIPDRGRAGLGIGILAGLALVIYLWDHYQPTFFFGLALILVDVRDLVLRPLPPAANAKLELKRVGPDPAVDVILHDLPVIELHREVADPAK